MWLLGFVTSLAGHLSICWWVSVGQFPLYVK